MPMFTTPERSHRMPDKAPKAAYDAIIVGAAELHDSKEAQDPGDQPQRWRTCDRERLQLDPILGRAQAEGGVAAGLRYEHQCDEHRHDDQHCASDACPPHAGLGQSQMSRVMADVRLYWGAHAAHPRLTRVAVSAPLTRYIAEISVGAATKMMINA